METWNKKTIVVTGAASGMGLASARKLIALGARVILADLRGDKIVQAAATLDGPGEAIGVELDITDRAWCKSVIDESVSKYGAIDALVNCAGSAMSFTPLSDVTSDLYRNIMSVNLDSTFHMCQAVAPHMATHGGGSIVNFASAVVARPRPGLAPYTAAKAGVIALTRTLALEMAEYKVRVNCILPGATDSPMLPKFVGSSASLEDAKAVYEESIPMGRLATPEDIAGGVVYLVSDSASFVTGESLSIDGGRGV